MAKKQIIFYSIITIIVMIGLYLLIGRLIISLFIYKYEKNINCDKKTFETLLKYSNSKNYILIQCDNVRKLDNIGYLVFNKINKQYILVSFLSNLQNQKLLNLPIKTINHFKTPQFVMFDTIMYDSEPNIFLGYVVKKDFRKKIDSIYIDGQINWDKIIINKNNIFRIMNVKFKQFGFVINDTIKISYLFNKSEYFKAWIVILSIPKENKNIILISFPRRGFEYDSSFIKDFLNLNM